MAIVKQSMCVLCALGFLSASSGFVSASQGGGAGGAGAGKVSSNPFTIKKTTNRATPRKTNGARAGKMTRGSAASGAGAGKIP